MEHQQTPEDIKIIEELQDKEARMIAILSSLDIKISTELERTYSGRDHDGKYYMEGGGTIYILENETGESWRHHTRRALYGNTTDTQIIQDIFDEQYEDYERRSYHLSHQSDYPKPAEQILSTAADKALEKQEELLKRLSEQFKNLLEMNLHPAFHYFSIEDAKKVFETLLDFYRINGKDVRHNEVTTWMHQAKETQSALAEKWEECQELHQKDPKDNHYYHFFTGRKNREFIIGDYLAEQGFQAPHIQTPFTLLEKHLESKKAEQAEIAQREAETAERLRREAANKRTELERVLRQEEALNNGDWGVLENGIISPKTPINKQQLGAMIVQLDETLQSTKEALLKKQEARKKHDELIKELKSLKRENKKTGQKSQEIQKKEAEKEKLKAQVNDGKPDKELKASILLLEKNREELLNRYETSFGLPVLELLNDDELLELSFNESNSADRQARIEHLLQSR